MLDYDENVIADCNTVKSFNGNHFDDEVTLIDGCTVYHNHSTWSFMLFTRTSGMVWVSVIGKIQFSGGATYWECMDSGRMRRITDKLLKRNGYKRVGVVEYRPLNDPGKWCFYYNVKEA